MGIVGSLHTGWVFNRHIDGPCSSVTTTSMNKMFTAVAVLQLMEQGELALEDTIPTSFRTIPIPMWRPPCEVVTGV